jgi:PAS domain S-box-containing protein
MPFAGVRKAHNTILGLYMGVGALWIHVSDRVAAWVAPSPGALAWLQTLKGWLFVAATALILHLLLRKYETEGLRANEALRESEERFRAAFDFAPSGQCLTSLDGRFLRVNRAFAALLGYDPEELPGMNFRLVSHPDDLAQSEGLIRRVVAGEIESFELEKRYLKKDGSIVWTLVRTSLLRSQGGKARHFISHVVDITERKRTEAEVRLLTVDLERRVAERTAQIEAANKELETFSYTVSHDLRSPLGLIDGFARLLLDEQTDRLDSEAKHYLDRILAACGRMMRLIDDLLDLSYASRREMVRDSVDLSAMARQIGEELQGSEPDRRVEFIVAPNLQVRADASLLRVILENLLRNAWKFTSKHASARIEVGSTTIGGKPAFFVRDDGAGFNPALGNRLFSPFQRLHSPNEFRGTGIGLATAQRIVERHGGRIWGESEVEKGATFYFTLE